MSERRELTAEERKIVDDVREVSPTISGWVQFQFKNGQTREQIWGKLTAARKVIYPNQAT
jgi:hypothetical protein